MWKHGYTGRNKPKDPTYSAWYMMLGRCNNPRAKDYPHYGGRGIRVCGRWHEFIHFLSDMGERPEGLTLDRINNDGNYEPGNCRWASRRIQAINRRSSKPVSFRGKTQTVTEWAREVGLSVKMVRQRLSKGWTLDDALTIPKMPRKAPRHMRP